MALCLQALPDTHPAPVAQLLRRSREPPSTAAEVAARAGNLPGASRRRADPQEAGIAPAKASGETPRTRPSRPQTKKGCPASSGRASSAALTGRRGTNKQHTETLSMALEYKDISSSAPENAAIYRHRGFYNSHPGDPDTYRHNFEMTQIFINLLMNGCPGNT